MAEQVKEGILKFKAEYICTTYPKPSEGKKITDNENNFGICVWEVIEEDKNNYKRLVTNYKKEVKVKGEYPFDPKPFVTYDFLVKEVIHPDYGIQYQLLYMREEIDFTHLSGQRAYLKTILSSTQLEGLFELYDNPIEKIANHDREAIKKVKGIGDVLVERIIRDFEATKDMSGVYSELDKLGLTTNFINKIISHYKDPKKVVDICLKNPYQLINDVDGIGFITADKVALQGGLPFNSIKRIKAYIIYYLETRGQAGYSYISARELNDNLFKTLGDREELLEFYDENDKSKNNLNYAIQELTKEKKIRMEEFGGDKASRRIYLMKYYNLEKEIAKNLKRILKGKNKFKIENVEEKIKLAEEKQGFEFTDEQKEGIKLGLNSQICLITGSAGSGKSSLVTGILSVLSGYSFAQCALSGKAAARLQEVTGEKGQTIHRLLCYDPKSGGFMHNEENPLLYDIVILDEVSLVGGDIFLHLLKAIPSGSKLYMLGDKHQLEAIGPLNLASDMIASDIIPTVELTKVHRQAQKSGILTTAYDIKNQVQIIDDYNFHGTEIRGELKDMVLEITLNKDRDKDLVLTYFKKYYESSLVNKDIMKIQIISPIKERGDSCVYVLNNLIQDYINPKTESTKFTKVKKGKEDAENNFSYELRENDKVMCIKNNYKTSASLFDEINTSIFNGWVGIIKEITDSYVAINFPLADYEIVYLPTKEVGNYIILGYCSTTHKLQGDSAEVIIGVIDYSTPPQMLTKQLVYTLITRAKKLCVLVAQNTALRKAINTNFVSQKKTFLQEFLGDK